MNSMDPKTVTIVQHVNFLTQINRCRINVSVILDANNPQLTMQSFLINLGVKCKLDCNFSGYSQNLPWPSFTNKVLAKFVVIFGHG